MYFVHPQLNPAPFSALKSIVSLLFCKRCGVKLNKQLSSFFPDKQFVFTDMGRTAFRLIIEKLNLRNSAMMLPAYICDIFRPILEEYGIRPIFLDIDLETFHVKIDDIKNKIAPNVKSILICHTYGLPLDVKAVREKVGGGIFIIEDCAHAFFAENNGAFAGNLGDVSFFSLYKQFPALRGGMLVCPKDWKFDLPKTSFSFRDLLSFLNYFWPFAFFFKKFGSEYAKAHRREEKMSRPSGIIRNSFNLFSDFFDDVQNSLTKRTKLALFFQAELKKLGFSVQKSEGNVFCYLSALVPENLREKRDEIVQGLQKYRVFCTRIWSEKNAIVLDEEFPNAAEAARRIVNFPLQNHYTEKDVEKMIKSLKKAISQL